MSILTNLHLLGIDPDEPIKMEVLVADLEVGGRLSGNPTDRSVAIVPLKDDQARGLRVSRVDGQGLLPLGSLHQRSATDQVSFDEARVEIPHRQPAQQLPKRHR